jgi:Na+-transporting NADH:ubiquinone oxidoreductase subunit F
MMVAVIFTLLVFLLSLLLSLAHRFLLDYGSCTITVIQNGRSTVFQTRGGVPLLQPLLNEGFRIPSSCGGQGSCGYCRVRILEPMEKPFVTELPFLSPAERRSGVRLACRYRIRRDCTIELPDHLKTIRELVRQGRIDERSRWRIRIE